jgi:hypothetical protein
VSWLIDENTLRVLILPIMDVIANGLTTILLRPYLEEEEGVEDAHLYRSAYDATELILRPDRSQAAIALFDRGQITSEVLRRESGFTPQDAPDEAEAIQQLLRQAVTQAPTVAPLLLPLLGVEGVPQPAQKGSQTPPPALPPNREGRPNGLPTTDTSPEGRTPVPVSSSDPASPGIRASAAMAPSSPDLMLLSAVADGSATSLVIHATILRALELAGNRLLGALPRSERGKVDGKAAFSFHTVLDLPTDDLCPALLMNAWSILHAALPDEAPVIEEPLTAYVTSLLTTGQEHTLNKLADFLNARISDARA